MIPNLLVGKRLVNVGNQQKYTILGFDPEFVWKEYVLADDDGNLSRVSWRTLAKEYKILKEGQS